jgi:hypothetical protein
MGQRRRALVAAALLAGPWLPAGCKRQSPAPPAPAPTPPPAAPTTPPTAAATDTAPAAAAPSLPTPVAPGYDPTKLIDQGKNPAEVYLAEPRDETWAGPVEAVVGGRMRSDVEREIPGAGLVLKCKSLSCLVGIDAPADKRERALAISKLMTLGPVTVDLGPEEDGTIRWLFFGESRMADANVFTAWYLKIRKRTLDQIREGKKPNPFGGEVPKD